MWMRSPRLKCILSQCGNCESIFKENSCNVDLEYPNYISFLVLQDRGEDSKLLIQTINVLNFHLITFLISFCVLVENTQSDFYQSSCRKTLY